jgi:hypothetical protein
MKKCKFEGVLWVLSNAFGFCIPEGCLSLAEGSSAENRGLPITTCTWITFLGKKSHLLTD